MKSFQSPASAARFFADLREKVIAANLIGVQDGAQLLLKTAQDEVGTYQDENTGPFPPWAELAEATKDDRVRQGYTENDPGLRSGDMRESYGVRTELAGPLATASIGSDDPKALWFENGTVRSADAKAFYQPPRSVLGVAAFREGETVAAAVALVVHRILQGRPLPNRSSADEVRDSL